ncbi:unnamed protein product [Absidia cylindrospora]
MVTFRPAPTTAKPDLLSPITSPSSTLSSLDSTYHSFSLPTTNSSPLPAYSSPSSTDTQIIKRQKTNTGLEAIVSQNTTHNHQQANSNWTLTVSKGNLIIRTDIKTHTELLDYLCKSVSSMEMNDVIPYSINDLGSNRTDALSRILQVFVWKRYGKSRFKSITYGFFDKRHKHNHDYDGNCNLHHNMISANDYALIQHDSISSITLKLFHAYLSCRHLHHLAIHVPTFLKILVQPDVMDSPAVLALCAVSCTASCRHVEDVLPTKQDVPLYGEFYFDQARQLAMDRFDDPCLEIFATFVLMALYKLILHQLNESRRYGDMAERISVILGEQQQQQQQQQQPNMDDDRDDMTMEGNGELKNNSDNDLSMGKKVLFRRLEVQLFKVLSVTHLARHKRHAASHHQPPDRRILNLFHGATEQFTPAAGDSEEEKRHIQLIGYIEQLNKECHNTAHQAPSEDTVNYVGIVGHMVEMAMRRWYMTMPASFRLNLPIFDAFSTNSKNGNSEWLTAMENAPDVIPLLTTMAAYNEYMMMVKAHVCKTPDDLEIRESLAAYWKENGGHIDHDFVRARWGEKWVIRLGKLDDLLDKKLTANYYENKANGISDDDDNDDTGSGGDDHTGAVVDGGGRGDPGLLNYRKKYDKIIITALLESGYAGFDDPAAQTSVKVALNAIQLLQYLRLRYPCHYEQRVALNAWDILLRATRFGFGDQEMKATIQANLLCCLLMIREEFEKIPFHGILVNYVDNMEQEYDQQFNFM